MNYSNEVNNELKSDEDMLYQIYNEIEKEDLIVIMENPEIIFKYIELAKESDKTKLEIDISPLSKNDDNRAFREYLKEDNKIKEEADEDSVSSYKSEKSLKSKVEPSSIIDTSNINDEKNVDKSHILSTHAKAEDNQHEEEEKKEPIDEKADVSANKSIEAKSETHLEEKPSMGKLNIPNNVKNMLMKQNVEKNKISLSNESINNQN